jgi:hypothetical protein
MLYIVQNISEGKIQYIFFGISGTKPNVCNGMKLRPATGRVP